MSKYEINQIFFRIHHWTIGKIHNHAIDIIDNHENGPDDQ